MTPEVVQWLTQGPHQKGGALDGLIPDPLPDPTYELVRYRDDREDFRVTVTTEAAARVWFCAQVEAKRRGEPITGSVLRCLWPRYPAPLASLRPVVLYQF